MNYRIYAAILFLISFQSTAQIGGSSTFQLLDLASPARTAAMGGTFISVKDNDINMGLQNPSLLNKEMDGSIAFSTVSYLSDVTFGDVAFAMDRKKIGTFLAGIHYINYGDFQETDNTGTIIGSFNAAEYTFNLGWGRPITLDSSLTIGAQARYIYSHLYTYTSTGIAGDISATYYDKQREWTVALVGRNIGTQLQKYTPDNKEPLPLEVMAAASKRLQHVPFRFNVTFRHLEKWDISYQDPNQVSTVDPLTGETTSNEISFGNKMLRHLVIGGEILLSKNFHLRAAYNGERKNEMRIESANSFAGWSFGFGLKIYHFQLSYGHAAYNLAGATDHFSITTNIHDFIH